MSRGQASNSSLTNQEINEAVVRGDTILGCFSGSLGASKAGLDCVISIPGLVVV